VSPKLQSLNAVQGKIRCYPYVHTTHSNTQWAECRISNRYNWRYAE